MSFFEKLPFIVKQAKIFEESLVKKADMERAKKDYAKKLSEHTDSGESLSQEQQAILFAEVIQTQFLKSPQSVVFPQFDDFSVECKDNRYIVKGFCDAQNSYGGLVREHFQILLDYNQGEWKYCVDFNQMIKMAVGTDIFILVVILMIIFVSI